jgi:hypothetical protein
MTLMKEFLTVYGTSRSGEAIMEASAITKITEAAIHGSGFD